MEERKRVAEEEWLYRRYYLPEKKYMNSDGTATSRVFKLREKDKGELSVDVKSMTTAEKSVGDEKRFFLFELPNKAVLQITEPQLVTHHDRLKDGTNDAHALIVGMTMEDDITPGLLARASKKVAV
jgi:hypothetical protein